MTWALAPLCILGVERSGYPIYINIEQSKTSPEGNTLEQAALNRAFASSQRLTRNIVKVGAIKIVQLNGKNTNKLGVQEHVLKEAGRSYTVTVTSIERTLVDIATRPVHVGGPSIVLECFRKAAGKVNVEQLVQTLADINHIYPYHQAIGFYMEKSGAYSREEMALLRKVPIELEFFLDYAMQEKTLCKEWKIWVPDNLK